MIPYELIVDPAAFRTAIAMWRQQPQLWIDTEVADWSTPNPRLSLLQVRAASGPNVVVDVLQGEMRQLLWDEFIPQVMANDQVEKWAHYARYERRFLGKDLVKNLKCTFEMAREVPYHRLPLKSLSLAALVKHFFGHEVDKTLQKADWGIRPLSQAHIEYAAADTEWCNGLYHHLCAIPQRPDPSEDEPSAIRTRYLELLAPLKDAQSVRKGIRDAVKEFMTGSGVSRLSRFRLDSSTTNSTDLRTLMEFALAKDPGGQFDLAINLSAKHRSEIGRDVEDRIRPFAEVQSSQTFRSPRAPRRSGEPPPYDFRPEDDERLTNDYEAAEVEVSILDGERKELIDRMKAWLRFRKLEEWEDFRFSSTTRIRWRVDVRALKDVITTNEPVQIPFPQRLRLAFDDSEIEALTAAGQSRQNAVLRWLPRASSVGVDAQLSREWHETESVAEAD